jgi:class 3 adenylate cyclase
LGAFERFADEMPLPQFYWNEWTATMEEARAQVGGEALVGALAEGREMTLEEAVEEASSAAPRTPASAVAKAPSPSVVTPLSPAGPGLQVVLFTDIEGSTRLAELVGDTQSQELRRVHDAITRRALSEYGGVEIKHTGDGFMASFQSVVDALGCSVALQRAFAEHNRTHPATPIRIRAGLNAGEPVAEDADLFGTTVNLAARICDTASPDQILVSNVVRELAAGRDLAFTRVEDVELKEISGVTPLFAVVWDRPAPTEDADSLAVPRVGKG